MELHRNARRVVEAGQAAGPAVEVRHHEGARTAQQAADEARAAGGTVGDVAA